VTWVLHSISSSASPLGAPQFFGHNFNAEVELRYTPGSGSQWSEPPALEWHERIVMVDHHRREHWETIRDQARYAPMSPTLRVWRERYIAAYNAEEYIYPGKACVLDNNRRVVHFTQPRGELWDNERKAQAVRKYLAQNGGYLRVEIHDIPALGRPNTGGTPVHKERLLTITCGLQGITNKERWTQYVTLNSATPQAQWRRSCSPNCHVRDLSRPAGFNTVFPVYRPPSMELADASFGRYV
jgi:hypothetical protein